MFAYRLGVEQPLPAGLAATEAWGQSPHLPFGQAEQLGGGGDGHGGLIVNRFGFGGVRMSVSGHGGVGEGLGEGDVVAGRW